MTTVDVIDPPRAKSDGTVELPAEIFDVQTNIPLIHQVVVAQLAAARQGTHSTKTRGEVRGGGKKPYRQKGTGRARQGSTRAPQFAGGGVVHGPHPRDYAQRTPKKMKAAALRGALSDRARDGRVHVAELARRRRRARRPRRPSRRSLAMVARRKHVLVVLERGDEVTWKSLRNVRPGAPARARPAQHLRRAGQPTTWSSPRPRSRRSWPARRRARALRPSRPSPRPPRRWPRSTRSRSLRTGQEGRRQEGSGEKAAEGRADEASRRRG